MNNNTKNPVERLREIFDGVVSNEENVFDGNFEEIDFYSMMCKASTMDNLYKMLTANVCMFNYKYNGKDSVLIVFSIPVSVTADVSTKHISERVMDIVDCIEKCLTTTDYLDMKEIKEDKFVYITAIKVLDNLEKEM